MVDQRLLKQLDSSDVNTRKKAIRALAQTKDPDAIQYLAAVFKSDPDPEVRDMALKAGKYIRKNAEEAGPIQPTAAPAARLPREDIYPDDGDDDDELLPEAIEVSEADKERANGLVQSALNLHMRDDNIKAAKDLENALRINPMLQYDSYVKNLISTITGQTPDDFIARLSGDLKRGMEARKKRAEMKASATRAHNGLALTMMVGALVMLLSFFTMPWFNLGPLPITADGQATTIGASFDAMRAEINNTIEGVQELENIPESLQQRIDNMISALNGLKIDFTGIEMALVAIGVSDAIEVMGMPRVLEATSDLLEVMGLPTLDTSIPSARNTPALLDFTLILPPIMAILILIIGMMLLTRSSTLVSLWLGMMLFSIGTLIPVIYFFAESFNAVVAGNTSFDALGTVTEPVSGTTFLGIGFWVAAVAVAIFVLCPVIALVIPANQPNKLK